MGYASMGFSSPGAVANQAAGGGSTRLRRDAAGNRGLLWHAWARTVTGGDPTR
jgi:hypothetical protein